MDDTTERVARAHAVHSACAASQSPVGKIGDRDAGVEAGVLEQRPRQRGESPAPRAHDAFLNGHVRNGFVRVLNRFRFRSFREGRFVRCFIIERSLFLFLSDALLRPRGGVTASRKASASAKPPGISPKATPGRFPARAAAAGTRTPARTDARRFDSRPPDTRTPRSFPVSIVVLYERRRRRRRRRPRSSASRSSCGPASRREGGWRRGRRAARRMPNTATRSQGSGIEASTRMRFRSTACACSPKERFSDLCTRGGGGPKPTRAASGCQDTCSAVFPSSPRRPSTSVYASACTATSTFVGTASARISATEATSAV